MERILEYTIRRNHRKGRTEISLMATISASCHIDDNMLREKQEDVISRLKAHLAVKLMEELNNVLGDYIKPRLTERLYTLRKLIYEFQDCSRQREDKSEELFSVTKYELLKENINQLIDEVIRANQPKPLNVAAIETMIIEEDDEKIND